MNEEERTRFEQDAQRALREQADALDAATRSRLSRARQEALAEFDRASARPAWLGSGWQPALGAAAVAVLAVALWTGRGGPPVEPALPATDDPALALELLLADDSLELIDELEFYDWVESQPAMRDKPERSG